MRFDKWYTKFSLYNISCFCLEEGGVRQDELVNWYLKEIEGEIETVQELTDKKLLVEKVIDRLVHHVSHMTSKPTSCD